MGSSCCKSDEKPERQEHSYDEDEARYMYGKDYVIKINFIIYF